MPAFMTPPKTQTAGVPDLSTVEESSANGTSISVSIIIPMRNEETYIGNCLESVLASTFPLDQYEVLVVDGGSTDRSRDIVLQKAQQYPNVRVLDNPQRVVPSGMNIGIRAARGRYIIRMDAHSEYPPEYIGNCVSELKRTGAGNVGGRLITRPGAESRVAQAIALLTQTRVGVGNSAFRLGEQDRYVDTVPFGAFRREIFDEVGLFREDLVRHQDYELNARIRQAGYGIYLSPKIHNVYYNVPSFRKFMRQGWNNGTSVASSWLRYPVCFCWRHAAPLAFVVAMAVGFGLGFFARPSLYAATLGAGLYSASLIITGASIAARHGWQYFFIVPALTLCYHLLYGFGSVVGIVTALASHKSTPSRIAERQPGQA